MNRKEFILLATAGAASLAIPTWYYRFRIPEYDPILKEPDLLSYIWDEKTLLAIGESYRKQNEDENDERTLVNLLTAGDLSTTEGLTEALQHQIIMDYQKNSIVQIDGWLVSVTEARQCALYSLTITT